MKTATAKPTRKSNGTRKGPSPMPAIFKNVPPGYDWGWYSREEPRMHLQVMDEEHKDLNYKVWLERQGKRVFEPVGQVPAKILKALKEELAKHRDVVEDKWARFMIRNGWLQAFLEGTAIKLIMYPRTEKRVRLVPLLGEEQHLTPGEVSGLKQEDINLNPAIPSIEFWPKLHHSDRHDIELTPYLWKD